MASACVNNIGVTPDNFLNIGWLSPRISFKDSTKIPDSDLLDSKDSGDFEFCLDVHDPVTILPADELFSDGKLVPLHFPKPPQSQPHVVVSKGGACGGEDEVRSPEKEKPCSLSLGSEQYLFSPKAPRCSSRWRELLGLKNKRVSSPNAAVKTAPVSKPSSIRHFLHRNSRMSTSSSSSSSDGTSLSLPLLHRNSDTSSIDCCSSRLSLSSSSSSGHEYDDLPRLSLDTEKLERQPRDSLSFRSTSRPKVRLVRPRMVPVENNNNPSSNTPKPLIDHPSAALEARRIGRSPMRRSQPEPVLRGLSVDSPRMNPAGKIVFQSLERSSSSPSTFNGGPRHKHRGMERSYSANVRITPVLNVPVCSLRGSSKSGVFGFGQLFSSSSSSSQSQKKDKEIGISNNSNNGGSGSSRYHLHQNHRRKGSS